MRLASALPSLAVATLFAIAAAAENTPEDAELRIMLQGSSAADMARLVQQHGGDITHHLPIINAVGARLSSEGLEKVLESPLVTRYLDDLSVAEQPENAPAETDESCDVGGSLELGIDGETISWALFNKTAEPAQLERLVLSWPSNFGTLATVQLGDQTLTVGKEPDNKTNELELIFAEGKQPLLKKHADLTASFHANDTSTVKHAVKQRDFNVEAHFAGDCSAKLIPGYTNNHENSFFPSVVGAAALHTHGVTGRNVNVAIIDSGLWEHEALVQNTLGENRLIASYNAITDEVNKGVFDESGHGTHMASVLAHSGAVTAAGKPTGSYKGIAPDVGIVAVKAFDIEGQGDFLDIVRAVQFVADQKDALNIRVLNLSFAARPRWTYWEDPVNQAIMRAWARGITVVAAAGNEGPDPMTIGSPGNLPYVITVGAVTDSWTVDTRDDDYIPEFSSRGPTPDAHIKPDLVAPGGHITGITRPGSTLTRDYPEYLLSTGEYVMTGSSQASALVSGIAALLLQLEPDLTPDDIKCKLMSSAEPAINHDGLLAYSPFQQGSGYASATRAITLGQRGCGNEGLDIQKDIADEEHYQGPAIVNEDGSTSLPGLSGMLSPIPAEKGVSQTRKWGVKDHIERKAHEDEANISAEKKTPFDWESVYLEEKKRIEEIVNTPR